MQALVDAVATFKGVAHEAITRPNGGRPLIDAILVEVILDLATCLAVLRGHKARAHKGVVEQTLTRQVREVVGGPG